MFWKEILRIQSQNQKTTLIYDFISATEFLNALTPREILLVFLRLRGETQVQLARFEGVSQPVISHRLRRIREKFEKSWIH